MVDVSVHDADLQSEEYLLQSLLKQTLNNTKPLGKLTNQNNNCEFLLSYKPKLGFYNQNDNQF